MYGKMLKANPLKVHITKLKKLSRFAHWNALGSQAIQDVVERIDRAYHLFFTNLKAGVRTAPPRFKSRKKYKSFTLKQAGWGLLQNGTIRIGKRIYRYFDSRPVEGNPKTLTVKRDSLGDIYIFIVTDAVDNDQSIPKSGPNGWQDDLTHKNVGYDFGLKTYLTASDGNDIASPQFFKRGINNVRVASKNLSRRKRGSNHREKARLHLARQHNKIANQRHDFHFKLAHHITDKYDNIFLETLNLRGMKRLWGRKISDLAFGEFVKILSYIAEKKDKIVLTIDSWFPSSKSCDQCAHVNTDLDLRDRTWQCANCQNHHDRDRNAALNIQRVGASTLEGEEVRLTPVSVLL